MSTMTQAMLINAVVLFAVLEADLGPHRKIGAFRLLRPLCTSAVLVPLFAESPATGGTGLTLELLAALAGLLVGLMATALTRVHASPRTGAPVSGAGFGYAALWTAVVAARAAFSYGSVHWFAPQLGRWAADNAVTPEALTDALLLMAVAMTLTRTAGLSVRARAYAGSRPAAKSPAPDAHPEPSAP